MSFFDAAALCLAAFVTYKVCKRTLGDPVDVKAPEIYEFGDDKNNLNPEWIIGDVKAIKVAPGVDYIYTNGAVFEGNLDNIQEKFNRNVPKTIYQPSF